MELESKNQTDCAVGGELAPENEIRFHNTCVAASILLVLNLVLGLFFIFSPNVLAMSQQNKESDTDPIAKSSAFEETVRDVPYKPHLPEKLRPVLEAVIPVEDPSLYGTLEVPVSAGTDVTAEPGGTASSALTRASLTTDTGDRSVDPAAYRLGNTEDSRSAAAMAVSVSRTVSDLQ